MVHEQFTKQDIDAARAQFDDLVVISIPNAIPTLLVLRILPAAPVRWKGLFGTAGKKM
jgi:quinolinate synthase